jgi:hypothetical protein
MRLRPLVAVALALLTVSRTRADERAVATVTSATVEGYRRVSALQGEERTTAILDLAGRIPVPEQAAFLFFANPREFNAPLPSDVQVAVEVFEQRPTEGRKAALGLLRSYNEARPALFKGLERVWDKTGTVEDFLCERLYQECKDRMPTIAALAARGTVRSMPTLVDVLFHSPEKEGLTFQSQVAIRAIAGRASDPDAALRPLLDPVRAGWPDVNELARRRDVILAMGASRGKAIPYLEGTLAYMEPYDLPGRSLCWQSLARIGSRRALHVLLGSFDEKLPEAKDEEKRLALLVDAIGEVPTTRAGANGVFVTKCGEVAEGLSPSLRERFLKTLERLTGRTFHGDLAEVRRVGEEIEKNRASAPGDQDDD